MQAFVSGDFRWHLQVRGGRVDAGNLFRGLSEASTGPRRARRCRLFPGGFEVDSNKLC